MVTFCTCSHDKALLSRRQAYVVSPKPSQDNSKNDDKPKGDDDKLKGDNDKAQDNIVTAPSERTDKPSD